VLRDNAAMMAFTASLGFHAVEDPDASDQWLVRLDL
jgi:hypothetical protein